MNKKRDKGFYWVQLRSGEWVVCEYVEWFWVRDGGSLYDSNFKQIDERKLIRNEV